MNEHRQVTSQQDFQNPPAFVRCGGKSAWRMIKVVHARGESWRARYAHNVLDGWDGGTKPDWSKISMKRGLQFEGWLELCEACNETPHRPNPTTLTQEEIDAHKDADIESIRRMLAEGVINELPYDKTGRGGEI